MRPVGYEYLRTHLALNAFPLRRPALVKPVTRVEQTPTFLAIPASVAPKAEANPLDHVLFALKHEGVNLQVLAEALPRILASDMLAAIQATPNGSYVRTACYLWEFFADTTLDGIPEIGGSVTPLFDPQRYVTGPARRSPRWRVDFNGLGSLRYCATVERTAAIEAGLQANLLDRTRQFISALDDGVADRTLAWAYLHETRDSFAIERETPSEDKERAFVAVLHQAHARRPLDEDYLVELQNTVVTNPLVKAAAFRHDQNHLQGPHTGAAAVTYVPPPPAVVPELMQEIMDFANTAAARIDPIVAASIASFGFVFVHPFTDGNGRLSRFIFHHTLCQSGKLDNGLVLPVSAALKKNEKAYLEALQDFSLPSRKDWQVRWIDGEQYDLSYRGDPGYSTYRYWDATKAVELGLDMSRQALDVLLRDAVDYLIRYDAIIRRIDARFDVRGSDLSTLVRSALELGHVSNRRKDPFQHSIPQAVFDEIDAAIREHVQVKADDAADAAHPPL